MQVEQRAGVRAGAPTLIPNCHRRASFEQHTSQRHRSCFPVCVVLGGERGGVSPQVMRLADAVIEIPMRGMANSINVATAAALVLYSISSRAMSRD
jgi:tRNA G18 (ribose-2'-O)-methylase SpoU